MQKLTVFIALISMTGSLLANPADLATVTIEKVQVPVMREFTGTVEAVNQATMKAQTSGRIAEVYFDVNDVAKKGELLARFSNKSQKAALDQAQAALDEASANYERNNADLLRYRDLYAKQLVAKSVLDQAEASAKAADARLKGAEAGLKSATENYEYTIIRAPYSGIVSKRMVEVGEAVNPGTPLFSGVSLNQLRVSVSIPQGMMESVRKDGKALVGVDGKQLQGTGITVFPIADELSHTFTTRINLPEGTENLYPGMLVPVSFMIGQELALVIPSDAMIHRGEINAVYVQRPDQTISMRQVRPGPLLADGRRVIHAGLSEGEKVFTDPLAAVVVMKQVPETASTGKAE